MILSRHRVSEELQLDRIADELPLLQLHEVVVTGDAQRELFVHPGLEAALQNAIGLRGCAVEGRPFERARGGGDSAAVTPAPTTPSIVSGEEPCANLPARVICGVDICVHLYALQRVNQPFNRQSPGGLEGP